jgi:hypothetical protein
MVGLAVSRILCRFVLHLCFRRDRDASVVNLAARPDIQTEGSLTRRSDAVAICRRSSVPIWAEPCR